MNDGKGIQRAPQKKAMVLKGRKTAVQLVYDVAHRVARKEDEDGDGRSDGCGGRNGWMRLAMMEGGGELEVTNGADGGFPRRDSCRRWMPIGLRQGGREGYWQARNDLRSLEAVGGAASGQMRRGTALQRAGNLARWSAIEWMDSPRTTEEAPL